jgi:hypothetical protein
MASSCDFIPSSSGAAEALGTISEPRTEVVAVR